MALTITDTVSGQAELGPCVRCEQPCARYPDGRRRLCDECDRIADAIITGVRATDSKQRQVEAITSGPALPGSQVEL